MNGLKALSDVIVYTKYARLNKLLNRKETFDEIVNRYSEMLKLKIKNKILDHDNDLKTFKRLSYLSKRIDESCELIKQKKVLPSMRALQFAGEPVFKNNARLYNCSYLPVNDYRAFSETMFLLLSGCGVGYSVQTSHVEQLPNIVIPTKEQKYLIGDSIEGWADSIRHLIASYFGLRSTKPVFDFSDIRSKGTDLITSGGKAPGPEPLKKCLFEIELILSRKSNGEKLTSLECHDIMCHIADAVLSGGIRRAAMISLFSADDESMITCKYGNWWESNSQRGRSNNSAVLLRHRIDKEFFISLWKRIRLSGSGEPGFYLTNNKEWGTNPCCEISLRPFQFCNLTEINGSLIENEQDFEEAVLAASFLGTLQASFTDFHYLRNCWKKTTEKEALLGIGITGIANNKLEKYNLRNFSNIAIQENKKIANLIGINRAARVTTVKPSGTTSCVLMTSSGIHSWHNLYYIRRIQLNKNEPIYNYLKNLNNSEKVLKDHLLISNSAVLEFPIYSGEQSITRDQETAISFLERVKKFNVEWVKSGHVSGDNTNNVSATVSIKDNEWEEVGEWMWNNKESFNGLSVLPYDGGTYTQAPFENITKEQYEDLVNEWSKIEIDLTQIQELTDDSNFTLEAACAGNSCDI